MRLPEDPQIGDVWKSGSAYLRTYIREPTEDVYLLIVETPNDRSVEVVEVPDHPYKHTHPISNLFIRRWFTRVFQT